MMVEAKETSDAPLKIALQTWGSDGDLHPFISLAGALARRGHEVTLALTSAERKSYRSLTDRLGVKLIEVGCIADSDEEMHRLVKTMYSLRNPLTQAAFVLDELLAPGIADVYRVARMLCEEHDVMIGHFILHPAHAAATQANIPYLTLTLNSSAIPTRSAPPVGSPDLGPWMNGMTWKLAKLILEWLIGNRINRWRTANGFAPLATFREAWESRQGNLIAVSPQLCPRPDDWEPHQHVCGFFPPPEVPQVGSLPQDLEAFLASGPAPVYFTFGSMLAVPQDHATLIDSVRLMVEAAGRAGCRAIVQAPWSRVGEMNVGPDIFRLERAPHTQVFPRCAAVVHHGGAGTTQTSLMCGKPSVVVAHATDQYFWGRELTRLGVAPAMIDRRRATVKKLAHALRTVLESPAIREKAARIGGGIAGEDGLGQAVVLIEKIAARRR